MNVSRRNLIALGAVGVGFAGLVGAGRAFWPASQLSFEAVSQPAGYRRLAGQGSALTSLVGGFDAGAGAPAVDSASALCDLAFQGVASGAGKLAIASFSDFFCPYCRVLDMDLRKIADKDPDVQVIWHQVPLLGVPSQMAAKGALSARNQGAYPAFQARLIRTSFVPNRAYLADFAKGEGLDLDRFMADLDSAETRAALAESAAAFRTFGFVGTPGLAVGRTLIKGAITPADLRALITLAKAQGPPPGCA